MSQIQPLSIRVLYASYFLVEGFDCGLYLSASPMMLMGRSNDLQAGLTRTFMRANGVSTTGDGVTLSNERNIIDVLIPLDRTGAVHIAPLPAPRPSHPARSRGKGRRTGFHGVSGTECCFLARQCGAVEGVRDEATVVCRRMACDLGRWWSVGPVESRVAGESIMPIALSLFLLRHDDMKCILRVSGELVDLMIRSTPLRPFARHSCTLR
jgi:hypothetical protein